MYRLYRSGRSESELLVFQRGVNLLAFNKQKNFMLGVLLKRVLIEKDMDKVAASFKIDKDDLISGLCSGLKFWNEVRMISKIATNNKKQSEKASDDELREHFDKAHAYLLKEIMSLKNEELCEIINDFDIEWNRNINF